MSSFPGMLKEHARFQSDLLDMLMLGQRVMLTSEPAECPDNVDWEAVLDICS